MQFIDPSILMSRAMQDGAYRLYVPAEALPAAMSAQMHFVQAAVPHP